MTTTEQALFKKRLKQLCESFGVTELVALIDIDEQQTGVVQVSLTDMSNDFYNDYRAQLETAIHQIKTPGNGKGTLVHLHNNHSQEG